MTPPAPHGPPTRVARSVSAIRLIVEAMSTTNASERARWISRAMSGTGAPASGSVSFPSGFMGTAYAGNPVVALPNRDELSFFSFEAAVLSARPISQFCQLPRTAPDEHPGGRRRRAPVPAESGYRAGNTDVICGILRADNTQAGLAMKGWRMHGGRQTFR